MKKKSLKRIMFTDGYHLGRHCTKKKKLQTKLYFNYGTVCKLEAFIVVGGDGDGSALKRKSLYTQSFHLEELN